MKKRILARALMVLLTLTVVTGALALETPATQSVSVNSVLGSKKTDETVRCGVQMPVFTEIPIVCESQESVEAESETLTAEAQEEVKEQTEYPLAGGLDLFTLDWREADDEKINHYLGMTDWHVIGQWLASLGEGELKELLARDTVLIQDTVIEEPDSEPVQMQYYEYAMQQYYAMMRNRAVYPAKASGYWRTRIEKKNASGTTVQSAVITFKISGVDTSLPTTERQRVTLAKSVTGNWCDVDLEGAEDVFNSYRGSESSAYPYVRGMFNYCKPAGYKVDVSYSLTSSLYKLCWNKSETFGASSMVEDGGVISKERYNYPDAVTCNGVSSAPIVKSEYNGRHYLSTFVNMFVNAGIGTTSAATQGNLIQTISLTPITYNVSYNGNGYTSGNVSAQNCTYDTNYVAQQNGFLREYTVTYNGNGGTPALGSQKASYSFKGWGLNQKNTVTYAAGSTYKNLTGASGASVTMYALWNPMSIKLPSASRTGYRFAGWNIGTAGATYTPSSNVTAVAKWNANTYTICFRSAGGSECEDISATYDKNVTLPVPERAGYIFNGWKGAAGTYLGSVKNLTDEHGATVMLVADWSAATDTPYTIRCYKQPSPDVKDKGKYVLFELENGDPMDGEYVQYGTTDETVSVEPLAVEGYVTPAAQSAQIAGDGSTIVTFYYDLIKSNSVTVPSFTTSDEELDEIAKRIAAGLSFSMDLGGVEYEIAQTEDGTLGIKFISTDTEKITIPDVVTIGEKVYRITEIQTGAFKGNQMLREVELSANISKISASAFEGCTSLKKVTLREGLVTVGSKAFAGCKSLKSVKLPSTVQSVGNSSFQNCSVLSKVTLNEGLLKIGNRAFSGCAALSKVSIPKTVLEIGSNAFAKCKKLGTVKFVSGSRLLSVGSGVFAECSSLKKIKLPSKLAAVSSKAFYKCGKLKSVTIGKSVTKIGSNAFSQCKKLTRLTIPSKVQIIGKKAFYKCTSLKKVTIKTKALTAVGTKAFKKCKKGIIFVVPKEKKNAYSKLFRGKY